MIVCPFNELSRYAAIIPGLEEALNAVAQITDYTPRTIPLSGGSRILVQQSVTKEALTAGKTEAHRNYLDIQYVVEGRELVGWAPLNTLEPVAEFNTEKDVGFFKGHLDFMNINAGYCYVVFPEDGHMPGVHLDAPQALTKLVLKLKV